MASILDAFGHQFHHFSFTFLVSNFACFLGGVFSDFRAEREPKGLQNGMFWASGGTVLASGRLPAADLGAEAGLAAADS